MATPLVATEQSPPQITTSHGTNLLASKDTAHGQHRPQAKPCETPAPQALSTAVIAYKSQWRRLAREVFMASAWRATPVVFQRN